MQQLTLFHEKESGIDGMEAKIYWLKAQDFDIRPRAYENTEAFSHRVSMSYFAFQDEFWPCQYVKEKWCPLLDWVDICPTGVGVNRLPKDKRNIRPYYCCFLRIRDVQPGFWLSPQLDPHWLSQKLPARATYIPQEGDIFLSRFREPMGKSVIYRGESKPLYVTSNFLLLRSKNLEYSLVLLALLKSSFLSAQLHSLIRRGVTTAEMHQHHAKAILLPALNENVWHEVYTLAKKRLQAELQFVYPKTRADTAIIKQQLDVAQTTMCKMDMNIDQVVFKFLKE
jgi:hypothetical protein